MIVLYRTTAPRSGRTSTQGPHLHPDRGPGRGDRGQPAHRRVRRLATAQGATPAQIALAWVQAQGVVPIPGTRRRARLDENAAATGLELTADDFEALDRAVPETGITGERDTVAGLARMNA
ncbi:aldo/keto reductase [Nocardia sp. NPDC005745]|uniref:aldo/keto reductase n=1 Tax=Nocardia sp. NPDC005745 TaxID=3157061 RepID=UPI0033D3B845